MTDKLQLLRYFHNPGHQTSSKIRILHTLLDRRYNFTRYRAEAPPSLPPLIVVGLGTHTHIVHWRQLTGLNMLRPLPSTRTAYAAAAAASLPTTATNHVYL